MKKVYLLLPAFLLFSCVSNIIPKDSDGDSVPDKTDQCPQIPGAVENNGCPWPDTDGDGVVDKDDSCPSVPGPAENNGCPWPDTDGDGILDKDDLCPTAPGLPEYKGCPKPNSATAMEVSYSRADYSAKRISAPIYNKPVPKKGVRPKQKTDYSNEEYESTVENIFKRTENEPLSTFSIDVDNASYSNIRRVISEGDRVNKDMVRIEEMINYFKYNYPLPKNQPFTINSELGNSPWNPNHKLLKIGLKAKEIAKNSLPPSNFVFLIDTSGSMNYENKLPLLKSAFKVLLDQLSAKDKVGIVAYAGSAGVVLEPTNATEKSKILEALDRLEAGGSTAGGAGIELAYSLAQKNFIKNGNNRVILATDGDFNVGTSSSGDLEQLITEKRKTGIYLTCLGFGMGNYKDNRMETLADKGNGNYAYIDDLAEAKKFLGREFAGNMYTLAKDVKLQVEFNPKFVEAYRLIGYENRRLNNEDFENDKIDAGELGVGHTVTAIYEIIPTGVTSKFLPKKTKLKYSQKATATKQTFNELATVKARYKKPDGKTSMEFHETVPNVPAKISSKDFNFATSVAWFGLILRQSDLISNKSLESVKKLATESKGEDKDGDRAEFVKMVGEYQKIVRENSK